jgi:protein O-mannosyl-transferase
MDDSIKFKLGFNQPAGVWRRDWLLSLLLVIATLLAYLPVWNGTPIWDDDAHLTKPELRSLQGLGRIWTQPGATQQYYPLVHTLFWVEHQLWGSWPAGYHLLSILLHCASALLLVRILRQLQIPGAWLAAAIFALHPIQAESVAWISELKNTLSGVFYFGSVLAYLKFDRTRDRGSYAVALALFIFGLMSKTVIATLPLAILIIFWWKRGKLSCKRDLWPLIPFFLLGTAVGVFTAWVERNLIGAQGADFNYTIIERFLIAGRVIWFYLGKLIWPLDLIFVYPRWSVSQTVWWQYLYPAAALLLLIVSIRLSRRWRAPLAGVLFFIVTLFPVLGFLNVYPFRYSLVADHFQYLASLGIITLVAAGIALLLKLGRHRVRPIGYLWCLALVTSLAILTWRQSAMYTNIETLWQTTIERNPQAWMAHNNLGTVLLQNGQLDEAIVHFRKALEIAPDHADTRANLGSALLQKGDVDEAIAQYDKALEIKPDYAEVHYDLGNALLLKGQLDEAIAHYKKTLEINPQFVQARANLAWALATSPQTPLLSAVAVKLAQQADQMTGGANPAILQILAAAYAQNGKFSEAIETGQRSWLLAMNQNKTALAEALRTELGLYEKKIPYRFRSQ